MAIGDMDIMPGNATGATTAPAPEAGGEIPEQVAKNPVVVAVLVGSVPGVYVRPLYYPKAVELAEAHAQDIQDLGLDFYGAQDGGTVLYNPAQITPEELAAADQQGKLSELLPDYEQLTGESPQKPPKGAKGFESAGPEQMLSKVQGTPRVASQPPVPKASQALQADLAAARVKNVLPSGPVSGSNPVAGQVSRAAAKTAI